MLQEVTLDDIEAIAIGAGILGTGGGGDPYLDSLQLRNTIKDLGPQTILDPQSLDDDDLLAVVGYIGAPTASIEKLQEGTELVRAVRLLEQHLGREINAIGIAEIGGGNAIGPIIAGLLAGLPTVDADGMGRAFPEVQMASFLFHDDVQVAPFAMVDAGINAVLVPHTVSDVWAERIARNLAVSMGATAGFAGMVMRGQQFKAYCVPYTLSLAHYIGRRVLAGRTAGDDIPAVIADSLQGQVIFRGKIIDVHRRTTQGFARGTLTLQSHGATNDQLYIEFQNEFLIAYLNNNVTVTVPDMICIVTEDTGQPIATELLRYGMRVAVLAVPGAAQLKTSKALQVVGPRAFGYDVDFMPLAGASIGVKAIIK